MYANGENGERLCLKTQKSTALAVDTSGIGFQSCPDWWDRIGILSHKVPTTHRDVTSVKYRTCRMRQCLSLDGFGDRLGKQLVVMPIKGGPEPDDRDEHQVVGI